MAEEHIQQNDADEEDADFEHEDRIVERVMESIRPGELPDDVDETAVAYFLWCSLTGILLVCGWNAAELAREVHVIDLDDAEPEGNA